MQNLHPPAYEVGSSLVLGPDFLEALELARLEEESPACGFWAEAALPAGVEPEPDLMVWEEEGGALGRPLP